MDIQIDRLGDNGEGIGLIPSGDSLNKVCFVDYALPGEKVDVDIFEDTKKYCRAKLKKVLVESPDRITPQCPYFENCGGCFLQHLKDSRQKEFKKQKILSSFKRIAGITPEISDVVSFDSFGYRNKMVFPVSNINGQVVIGMYKSDSHDIVDINECKIANENINLVLKLSKDFFKNNLNLIYDDNVLILKYLVVRNVDDKLLVTLVLNKPFNLLSYYQMLNSKFDSIGVSYIISDNKKDILGGEYHHAYGIDKIYLEEFGIKYSIDNRSFFQVNTQIKYKLYERILSEISNNSIVLDGYSGAGLLTAIVSKKCSTAVGVEINSSASRSAENLKKTNGLHNIEFVNANFKDVADKYLKNTKDMVIILDPPRAGCDKIVIDLISKSGVEKIIYVSCNSDSLARDISRLNGLYEITSITPFEMFSQTKHIETLVCLQRRV